jgi:hypothetical protein
MAALLSRSCWFETEVATQERNLSDLAIMNQELTARGKERSGRGSSDRVRSAVGLAIGAGERRNGAI